MPHIQCNAIKSNGEQCRSFAINGTTKCRAHGGATPRGMASPNYKHGRFSKYMPRHLLTHYKAAMSDGKLISLREDLAVIDARMAELMGRIEGRESANAWAQAREAQTIIRAGFGAQDTTMIQAGMRQLTDALSAGQADYKTWDELTKVMDVRRKIVESERRFMVELQQMLTIEDVTMIIDALASSIKRNVTDVRALSAIQQDITAILGREPSTAIAAGNTIEGDLDR